MEDKIKFPANVILIDVAFLNEVVYGAKNFLEGKLGRKLPDVDLPAWLSYLALDAGLREQENQRIARIAAEQLFFQSYSRYLDLFRFTSEERYLQLLKKCPEILQMVPLKEIASYLKITPIHMSRIRHKQSFDSKE